MSREPDAMSDERNECKRGKGDDACAERAGSVTKTENGKRENEDGRENTIESGMKLGNLISQQTIPVDSRFRRPLAAEYPFQALLRAILRRACRHIPHLQDNLPLCHHYNLVLVRVPCGLIEPYVAHYPINETGGEDCFSGVMDLAFEVGWKPNCHV